MILNNNSQLGLDISFQTIAENMTVAKATYEPEFFRLISNNKKGSADLSKVKTLASINEKTLIDWGESEDRILFTLSMKSLCLDKEKKHIWCSKSFIEKATTINIKENFSFTALDNMENGNYIFLLGRNETFAVRLTESYVVGLVTDLTMDMPGFENLIKSVGKEQASWTFNFKRHDIPSQHDQNWRDIEKVIQILVYYSLGETEKRIVKTGQKLKLKIGHEDKFLNKSTHDIELIDINWNIESQRFEGFSVTGHFRLQPWGEGNKKRKLIWIKDFQKEGYIKKAKTTFN